MIEAMITLILFPGKKVMISCTPVCMSLILVPASDAFQLGGLQVIRCKLSVNKCAAAIHYQITVHSSELLGVKF